MRTLRRRTSEPDRLEAAKDLLAPCRELLRQLESLAQLLRRLVAVPAALVVCHGQFEEGTAGRPDVDRLEVLAVSDFGHIGIARTLYLEFQVVLILESVCVPGEVVDSSGAVDPRPRLICAIDNKLDRAAEAGLAGLQR